MQKFGTNIAAVWPYSILPQKCGQAANDGNQNNDSKHHTTAENHNTRMGFRAHENILGWSWLSSALQVTVLALTKQ